MDIDFPGLRVNRSAKPDKYYPPRQFWLILTSERIPLNEWQ